MAVKYGQPQPKDLIVLTPPPSGWPCRYGFDPTTGTIWWEATERFSMYAHTYNKGWHRREITIDIKGEKYKLSELLSKSA